MRRGCFGQTLDLAKSHCNSETKVPSASSLVCQEKRLKHIVQVTEYRCKGKILVYSFEHAGRYCGHLKHEKRSTTRRKQTIDTHRRWFNPQPSRNKRQRHRSSHRSRRQTQTDAADKLAIKPSTTSTAPTTSHSTKPHQHNNKPERSSRCRRGSPCPRQAASPPVPQPSST